MQNIINHMIDHMHNLPGKNMTAVYTQIHQV